MKKITSIVLAVLVVFSMFTFIATAAGASVAVTADKTSAKVGDTITVTAAVAENSDLGTLTVDIAYNHDVLEVVAGSSVKGEAFSMEELNENYKGGIRYAAINSSSLNKAATLFTVKFKVVGAGDANLAVVAEGTDANDETVKVSVNVAKVTVAAEEKPTEKPTEPEQPTDPEEPTEHKHSYSEWKVVTKATCDKDGEKIKTCKVCGDSVKEAIPATGHKEANKWEVTKPATTTATGTAVKKCTVCGKVLKTDVLPKLEASADSTKPNDSTIPGTDAVL